MAQSQKATFGAGCFWCVEAVFQRVAGVASVLSGYSGGTVADPSYEAVCAGKTGHAEVCQVEFDPSQVSYEDLLLVFWRVHDPTTLNRQGNDVGTQYRSAVFYHDEAQKAATEKMKREIEASGAWGKPLVTEIAPYKNFYPAEEYHRDYFNRHSDQTYCQLVIQPKLDKFVKEFREKLRSSR